MLWSVSDNKNPQAKSHFSCWKNLLTGNASLKCAHFSFILSESYGASSSLCWSWLTWEENHLVLWFFQNDLVGLSPGSHMIHGKIQLSLSYLQNSEDPLSDQVSHPALLTAYSGTSLTKFLYLKRGCHSLALLLQRTQRKHSIIFITDLLLFLLRWWSLEMLGIKTFQCLGHADQYKIISKLLVQKATPKYIQFGSEFIKVW